MAGSDVFVAGTDQCDIWEVSERPEAGGVLRTTSRPTWIDDELELGLGRG